MWRRNRTAVPLSSVRYALLTVPTWKQFAPPRKPSGSVWPPAPWYLAGFRSVGQHMDLLDPALDALLRWPLSQARLAEGFSHFVTSMTAPVASGWSDRRGALHPLEKHRLTTAPTHRRHWSTQGSPPSRASDLPKLSDGQRPGHPRPGGQPLGAPRFTRTTAGGSSAIEKA